MAKQPTWTLDKIAEAAKPYQGRRQFKLAQPKAYDAAVRTKVVDQVCAHMRPSFTAPNKKWARDTLLEEAKKYTTRHEFQKKAQRAYTVARELKVLDEACQHMTPVLRDWTRDNILQEAKLFTTRAAYFEYGRSAYYAGIKMGIHEEACAHMLPAERTSLGQEEVKKFLEEVLGNEEVLSNYKDTSNGRKLELDCYVPGLKVGVEYNGLEYHSEEWKDKQYHLEKREYFEKLGVRVVTIHSDEWKAKKDVVKSILRACLRVKLETVYARELQVTQLSSSVASTFFEENHLMGGTGLGYKALGLTDESGNVACCMSYKVLKDGGVDVYRFASKLDTRVAGGLSRLMKHVEELTQPTYVQSFVDLRYGTGHSLVATGFKLEGVTLGWRWTDGYASFNRLQCMAGGGRTEKENAERLGWVKIYDSGQAKFVKRLGKEKPLDP